MGRPYRRDLGAKLSCCGCSDGGNEPAPTDAASCMNGRYAGFVVSIGLPANKNDKMNKGSAFKGHLSDEADFTPTKGDLAIQSGAVFIRCLGPSKKTV